MQRLVAFGHNRNKPGALVRARAYDGVWVSVHKLWFVFGSGRPTQTWSEFPTCQHNTHVHFQTELRQRQSLRTKRLYAAKYYICFECADERIEHIMMGLLHILYVRANTNNAELSFGHCTVVFLYACSLCKDGLAMSLVALQIYSTQNTQNAHTKWNYITRSVWKTDRHAICCAAMCMQQICINLQNRCVSVCLHTVQYQSNTRTV